LVFIPYAGSEGYSPAPYLTYLPALGIAHVADLDFVSTLYLMRIVGFIILTALMASAIFLVPDLGWAFAVIGLLPSALFSRSVLSADGGALAYTMLLTAVSLRSAKGIETVGAPVHSLLMALCVLSKPPQLVFILLAALRRPINGLARQWKTIAIVVVPALAISLAWVLISSGDVAAWRFVEGSELPPEHYQPLWKLHYLFEHPWHFVTLLLGTYHHVDDYWLQLIGILGWLDMPLRPWVYPVLTGLLLAAFWTPIQFDLQTRRRVIAIGAMILVAYTFGVFLIFYLVWTGLDQTEIAGVQGRYFVVLLPIVALMIAAAVRRGLSGTARAVTLVASALLSSLATIDAVARSDWKFALLPF